MKLAITIYEKLGWALFICLVILILSGAGISYQYFDCLCASPQHKKLCDSITYATLITATLAVFAAYLVYYGARLETDFKKTRQNTNKPAYKKHINYTLKKLKVYMENINSNLNHNTYQETLAFCLDPKLYESLEPKNWSNFSFLEDRASLDCIYEIYHLLKYISNLEIHTKHDKAEVSEIVNNIIELIDNFLAHEPSIEFTLEEITSFSTSK